MDYMSQLLAIGEGGEAFFVSCLLHLSPEDLKACRLVNKTWNKLIKERVWGNKKARKRLEEKLLNRWKTTDPETVQLGTVSLGVQAMFCNNSHVFCGMQSGKVRVYNLTDGQWVRDLESGEEDLEVERICGGESIVAAKLGFPDRVGAPVVTVWSSKQEMERLHSFDVRNHEGMKRGRVVNTKVSGNKVFLLLKNGTLLTHQLVVLHEGEHNWENKILESFTTPRWHNELAIDNDWLAVAGEDESRPDVLKVKLWKEELFRQDIELPGVSAGFVSDVVLESPFFIVGGTSWLDGRLTGWIRFFQLAADNLMEDLNYSASLIKTLQFPCVYARKLLCTGLVLGCLLYNEDDKEHSLVLFEKNALLDTTTPPEETEKNLIHLGANCSMAMAMSATSLVFTQKVTGQEDQWQNYLCKKDFWISRANTA